LFFALMQNNNNKNVSTQRRRTPGRSRAGRKIPASTRPRAQRGLRAGLTVDGANYLRCRANPFGFANSNGIPDSTLAKRITIDHRATGQITIGNSGGAVLRLAPWLPCPLAAKPLGSQTGFIVNGQPIDISNGTFPATVHSWAPVVSFAEYATYMSADPTTDTVLPFSATQGRIVAIGLQIRYISAPLYATGTITVLNDSVNVSEPTYQPNGITLYNATANLQPVLAANTTYAAPVNQIAIGGSLNLTASSYVGDVLTPVNVTPKRISNNYNWRTMAVHKVLPITETNIGYHSTNLIYGNSPGLALYDPEWQSKIIRLEGAPVGGVFRFDLVVCTEYIPSSQDPATSFAKAPTPDKKAIDTSEKKESVPAKDAEAGRRR